MASSSDDDDVSDGEQDALQTQFDSSFTSSFRSSNAMSNSFAPSASSFHMSYFNANNEAYQLSDFRRAGTFKAHKQIVTVMVMIGNKLVTGCADSSIKVWDVGNHCETVRLLKIINGHEKGITALTECDGKLVSCSLNDRSIRVWDPRKNWKQTKWISDHTTIFHSLLGISTGVLCAGSYGGTIKVYDPSDRWECGQTIRQAHLSEVIHLLEVHNLLASSGNDFVIKLWDPRQEFVLVGELCGHSGPIPRMHVFQDYLVSCSLDRTVKIWQRDYVPRGEATWPSTRSRTLDSQVAVKHDPKKSTKTFLTVRDKFAWRCIKTMGCLVAFKTECKRTVDHPQPVTSVGDIGGLLATACQNGRVKLYDPLQDWECIQTIKDHHQAVTQLLAVNGMMASCSVDRSVILYACDKNPEYNQAMFTATLNSTRAARDRGRGAALGKSASASSSLVASAAFGSSKSPSPGASALFGTTATATGGRSPSPGGAVGFGAAATTSTFGGGTTAGGSGGLAGMFGTTAKSTSKGISKGLAGAGLSIMSK